MAAVVARTHVSRAGRVGGTASAAVLSSLVALNHTLTHDLRGELGVIKLSVAAATSGSIPASAAIRDVATATKAAERTLKWSLAEMKTILAGGRSYWDGPAPGQTP